MQKGHLRSPVLILLTALILFCMLFTGGARSARYERAVGPLLPVNGVAAGGDPNYRPIIGLELPTPPMMMQTQGSGPDPDENLTATATGSEELYPSASPGSTQNRIVFASNGVDEDEDRRIDDALPVNPNFNLWIMRSDGSEQYMVKDMVGDQIEPSYDPSGRLIVFASQVSNVWQIFTIEVRDPSIVKQITTGPGNKRHPSWSPDSGYISFQSDVNGDWDIYKIIATGAGSPIQITFGPTDDTAPAWSPNGLLIAFTRAAGGVSRVYTTSPDGADIEQITNGGGDPAVNDKDAAWRRSGSEIGFSSDRSNGVGDAIADYNIWRVTSGGEVGGAIPTLISNTSIADTANDTDPTWSVDIDRMPMRVAFTSTRAGTPDIWSMQLDDWRPPLLGSLPTVTDRLAVPGDDVTISVPVYDRDSGVATVRAYIKSPDVKQRNVLFGHPITGEFAGFDESDIWFFDDNFDGGHRAIELGCAYMGNVDLTDPDGDGVFTGTWPTQNIASGRDYIIDVYVLDNAGNFVTFDDVYGFSTKQFSPRYNLLFVNDYCEGQRFISQLGWNNDIMASFPCESYYMWNPGTHISCDSTVEKDSILGAYEKGYDVWRIICRGPVPSHVYQYYLPTVEYQLDPSKLDDEGSVDVTADRLVPVADRGIIWGSPHCGDVWASPGSLVDASTQADVALFLQRGGRLFLSGEDILWALTMNGTRSNNFVSNSLRASFVQDCAIITSDVYFPDYFSGMQWRAQRVTAEFGVGGAAGDPVSYDPWIGSGAHAGDRIVDIDNWFDTDDNPMAFTTPRFQPYPTTPWFSDAHWFSIRPDSMQITGDAVKIYGLGAGEADDFDGPAVGLRWQDTAGMGGRLVFLSFGFEQIHRGYHIPSNLPPHCRNMRSHLIHNSMCWMRTGGLQGIVVNIDGSGPINDPPPIVTLRHTNSAGQLERFAVRCQTDGTWLAQGLSPGWYDIDATRPGFEIDHYDGEFVHGGQVARTVDIALKRAQPGAVTGVVTSAATGDPLANVSVSVAVPSDFTGTPPVLPDPVLTAADGTYTLPYIPEGDYVVTADGTAILYGTDSQDVTVAAGDTTRADFALDAADGTLEGTVVDADTNDPIRNAAVVVQDSVGNRTTGYTDSSGLAVISLPPGDYTVRASAPGYVASAATNITIQPAATEEEQFALAAEPGGAIAGRVVAAGSGAFVGGVSVRVFFGDEEIAEATSKDFAVRTINGVGYNYELTDVPTGEVTVMAERAGFSATPAERTVLILSAKTTKDVNFSMDSLRTFPRGLQLVSFPWDYSTVDPRTLLGVTGNLGMATWEAARQRYAVYPEAPADRFRLGVGYWMSLDGAADLTQEGAAAADPVEIPLGGGWNLIGDPYNRRLDFYTSRVRDINGAVLTLQQAMAQGIIGSSLYAYVLGGYQSVGVLSPYTGYWLRTNAPCALIMSEDVGALAAGAAGPSAAPRVTGNGWLMQLKTSVSGVQDTATTLGWSRSATAGCDFALDEYKPPVPAMGAYVYTAIDNRNWQQGAGEYAVDVRPADLATTWDLTVTTNQVGERVTLSWDDLSSLPNGVRPVLVDVATGQKVYMRTSRGFAFGATDEPRRLQVQVSPAGMGQLVITPQAAAEAGGGVAISYTLSRAAAVDVLITNLAGRTIRQLSSGQSQAAGLNTVRWDGRDKSGLLVPAGRYLVTVMGRTDAGQESRAVMPLERRVR